MRIVKRASNLLKANINHLLDSAEDPEVMIKQLIREMDESVTELRRETVNAVAREKQLRKKVAAAGDDAAELEKKAVLALDHDNQALARKILGQRVEVLKRRESLHAELQSAESLAKSLKNDLVRMQQQADLARSKKDELIRRKRAAEASMRTQDAARRSAEAMSAASGKVGSLSDAHSAFGGYADEISQMEARAEAAKELSDSDTDDEIELKQIVEASEVDRELERLKAKRASNG